MAKHKKKPEDTISDYYDLKVDEVDALVAALKEGKVDENEKPLTMDIGEITGEDTSKLSEKKRYFNPYHHDFISSIPVCVKALFIKWWFAGMVVYFITLGLGVYVPNELDRIVIGGIVFGLVNELLVNPIFRMMETDRREYNAYMLFPFPIKQYWTFFANIFYYVFVYYGAAMMIEGVNVLVALIRGIDEVTLPAEPLFMGLCCVIADMAVIGIKDLAVYLIKKSKKERLTQDV